MNTHRISRPGQLKVPLRYHKVHEVREGIKDSFPGYESYSVPTSFRRA